MAATSSAAIAISAAAAAQASAAKTAACKALMQGFQHDGATVAEVQDYGRCAKHVYPEPLSADGVIWAKVLVALLIASVVLGVLHGIFFRNGGEGPIEGPALHGLIGLLIMGGSILTVVLLYAGVQFLMS